jgi:hypothetical protein
MKAVTATAAPAWTNRTRAWLKTLEKRLIQFFPAYLPIVNQRAAESGLPGRPVPWKVLSRLIMREELH